MIKVYFQSIVGGHSELVATFTTDELYNQCLPSLEEQATKQRCIVTETDTSEESSTSHTEDLYILENAQRWFVTNGYSVDLDKDNLCLWLTIWNDSLEEATDVLLSATEIEQRAYLYLESLKS
jgi:hypothetical protein